MIINKIRLKNFRSFEEEMEFNFTPTKEKNIVLIGGENGAGKSTLFEAMKLCIYGPISYGYQGHNSNYLSKIKGNINNNSFKYETVDSFINVVIELKEGVDNIHYSLTRKWTIKDKKLSEEFIVLKNDKILNNEEILYFENYFKSILPPSLFDFFFFDGEELSDFFIGNSASTNLKDAVLQLFNYDTFNILKKNLVSYQRSNSHLTTDISQLQEQYDKQSELVKCTSENINTINSKIDKLKCNLESLELNKLSLESDFRNSGGILEKEKNLLLNEISKLENERNDINQFIKDYCNDILPFLIILPLLKKTKDQINNEENLSSFLTLKSNINGEIIKKAFKVNEPLIDLNSNINFNNIADTIVNTIFSDIDFSKIKNILKFSSDQRTQVLSLINNILPKNKQLKKLILSKYERLQEISHKLRDLRERLNYSVTGEILNNYLKQTSEVNEQITYHKYKIEELESLILEENIALSSAEYALVKIKNQYASALQSNNILNLSNNILDLLDSLVENLSKDKITTIETNFIQIFKTIIRKDNYINDISIDDNFKYTLYIDKDYNSIALINMLNNINFEEIEKKYGTKFILGLFEFFNVSNKRALIEKLNSNSPSEIITLKTKVDVNGFSKGEKQIYILCLIWALIKSSGINVPFIIDTPYARIDETHRKALSTLYLPNISNQVIILSTNEEIDLNLYEVVKPYICNEYLLIYNDIERKTEVKKGYFKV